MNILTYDGVSSQTFGLYVGFSDVENAPERSIDSIQIPGRNGALTIDHGYYENITVPYICFIREDFETNIAAARAFFLSKKGYKRLEDTANPDTYRMARYSSGLEVKPSQMRRQGYFTLTFDCMPQRFLKAGDEQLEFSANGQIYNPTLFDAKPIIRVYGNGVLGVGSETITISQNPGYIDIDCDMQSAYYGAVNCNDDIVLSSGKFPTLAPGQNGITLSGITRAIVTPHWWTL